MPNRHRKMLAKKMKRNCKLFLFIVAAACLFSVNVPATSRAQGIPNSDFSIEVSPSPLSATVQPGKAAKIELKIRNASLKPERLKIESRSFVLGANSEGISISDTTPKEMKEWIHYSDPEFAVTPGAWFSQTITISLPESAGFSYPFAVVISRANDGGDSSNGRLLKGSVAVFTLLNIDKPGATRKLELETFTSSQAVYEYLPARLKLILKNTGNSIVQPYGNIYIQRDSGSVNSISVLPVNSNQSYILPGKTREFTASWDNGFPVYTKGEENKDILSWNPTSGAPFRFGHYTAKVVAVYNDGSRDIPITSEIGFRVIPWKLLLAGLVIVALVCLGFWSLIRKTTRKIRALRASKQK